MKIIISNIFIIAMIFISTAVSAQTTPSLLWFNATSPREQSSQYVQFFWAASGGTFTDFSISCSQGKIRLYNKVNKVAYDCGRTIRFNVNDKTYAFGLSPQGNVDYEPVTFTLTLRREDGGAVTDRSLSIIFNPSVVFDKDLYVGLRNNSLVRFLQQALIFENFYQGPVTGNYFGLTEAAVRKFQAAHGMLISGRVDAAMRARLNGQ